MWFGAYLYVLNALMVVQMVVPSLMVMKRAGDAGKRELRGDLQCQSNRVVIVYLHGSSKLISAFPGVSALGNGLTMDLMAIPSFSSGSLSDIDQLVEEVVPRGSTMGTVVHHKAMSSFVSLFADISKGVASSTTGDDFIFVHKLHIDEDTSDEKLRHMMNEAVATLSNHFGKDDICFRYVWGMSDADPRHGEEREGGQSPFDGLLERKLAAETPNIAASALYEPGRSLSMYQSGLFLNMTPEILCGLLTLFVFIITVILGLQCTNDVKGSSSFTDEKSVPNIGKEA